MILLMLFIIASANTFADPGFTKLIISNATQSGKAAWWAVFFIGIMITGIALTIWQKGRHSLTLYWCQVATLFTVTLSLYFIIF